MYVTSYLGTLSTWLYYHVLSYNLGWNFTNWSRGKSGNREYFYFVYHTYILRIYVCYVYIKQHSLLFPSASLEHSHVIGRDIPQGPLSRRSLPRPSTTYIKMTREKKPMKVSYRL